jgi:hypothetical protein
LWLQYRPSFTSNLESIVIGGRQIPTEPPGEHMREGARARSRMGARARVSLPPEGREAGRACSQGRLFLGWAAFGMAGFLEVVAVRCYY